MALSGSTSVAVTAYDTLKFNWVQNGQSTVNNLTTINWSLQLISGSAGKIISSTQKAWSVTINGTPYTGTSNVGIENNTSKTLASGQVSIPHNADGSKSFSYSFSQAFNITFAGASVRSRNGNPQHDTKSHTAITQRDQHRYGWYGDDLHTESE